MSQSSIFPVYIKTQYDGSGGAFDQLTREARNSVDESKRIFDSGYSQIQGIVSKALSVPRNDLGSLDLGVDEYRRAAQEADALAIASREVANAMQVQTRAAASVSKEDQLVAASARAAATAAETQANEYRALARAAELTQEALNRQKSATDAVVTSTTRGTDAWGIHAQSMRGSRQAMVQTGQQMQDLAISLYGGQRASVVFAQQIPQLAFALTSLEGSSNKTADKIGRFATILSGPWSIAVVAASALLGGLIDRFLLTDDAAKKTKTTAEDVAEAFDFQKGATDQLNDALKELIATEQKRNEVGRESAIVAFDEAKANLSAAISTRERLKADAERASLDLAKPSTSDQQDEGRMLLIQQTTTALNRQDAAIENLNSLLNQKFFTATREFVDDPSKAIAERKMKALNDEFKVKKNITAEDQKQYRLRYDAIKQEEDAAKKKASTRSTSAADRAADAAARTINFALPVSGGRISSEFGKRTDPITGQTSFHAGRDYAVPTGTRVRAPAEGVVSEVGRNPSSANGIFVRINHGGGTESTYLHLSKADVVEGQVLSAGEYLGLSGNTGRSTGAHLHEQFKVNGKVVDPRRRGLQVGAVDDLATDIADKQGQAYERAIAATEKYADSASSSISRVTAMWDDQPKLIDRSSASVAEMSGLVEDLTDKLVNDPSLTDDQRGLLGNLLKSAEAAKALAAAAPDKPIRDMVETNAENAAIDSLRLQNLNVEAEVLTRTLALAKIKGSVTEKDAETIAQIVMDENRRAILLEKQNEAQQRSLQTLEATQSNLRTGIRDLLGGKGFSAIGDIFKRQWGIYLDSLADQFAEQLFGESFRQEKLKILGLDKVDEAGQAMGVKVTQVVDELERFRQGLAGAAGAVGAANDNPESTVTAARKAAKGTVNSLSPVDYFTQMRKSMAAGLESSFGPASGPLAGVLTGYGTAGKAGGALGLLASLGLGKTSTKAGDALKGLQTGRLLSGAFGLDSTGSDIGGVIGSVIPGIGSLGGAALGGLLGKGGGVTKGAALGAIGLTGYAALASGGGIASSAMLGTALGVPVIALGAILGGLIATIFKKAKTGSASVTNGSVSLGGNNAERRDKLGSAAGGISDSLAGIAAQLGGTLGDYGYSIGVRKDEYRVSGSAGANVTSKNPGGLIYKGKDGEEAARIALLNAIQDGAITGIRAGAQRLLQAGKDLEGQIQKALSFQSIFDRLKAYEDPMGAALDKLDREFENLRKIAIEAGEGMVELEKLYGIERANVIKEANEKITSSLRGLYDSLTVSNDARSLSERRALAQSKYDPLATRVAAGDTTAYDDFAAAAQTLLDIERQIFGSQGGYFSRLDEITSLTKTRIDAESNVAAISSDRPGLFTPTVANDNVPVVNAIDAQTGAILAVGNQTNTLLATLLSKWNGTTGMPFSNTAYF